MSVEFETYSGYKDTLEVSKGSAAFFYLPNTRGKLSIYANEKLTIVSLHCSPKFVSQFIDSENMTLSGNLIQITENKINKAFVELTNSNTWMTNLINQIYNCNFEGASKKMFLEAKSIELITILIEHLKSQFVDENDIILTQVDLKKIQTVETILKSDLVEVPTLLELANIAGMSHTKLNKSFKKVFGNTVFNHLRELRIEKAKELLALGTKSITDIAYETGWSSPSHFTKEFTNKFNITPKSYMKISNDN